MPLKNKSIGNYSSSIQLNNSVSSQSSKDDLNVPILDNLSLRLHQRKITCTSFSCDSSRALSGCAQGAINVWSYESGETLDILSTQVNDPVSQVQFSPTDKFILAGFTQNIYYYGLNYQIEIPWKGYMLIIFRSKWEEVGAELHRLGHLFGRSTELVLVLVPVLVQQGQGRRRERAGAKL